MDTHIGLLVYNAKANGRICPGLHVWDGSNWVALGGNAGAKPDITMTDADNNIYKARWFSTDPCDPDVVGAYWTTSNIYSTQKAGGGAFEPGVDLDNRPRLNPAYYAGGNGTAIAIDVNGLSTSAMVKYGETTAASAPGTWNKNESQQIFASQFGLTYTHYQAMHVCPTGWHLPGDDDWKNLMIAMGGAKVAGAKIRKRPAEGFYSFRSVDDYEFQWGIASESNDTPSGFDALPTGDVHRTSPRGLNFGFAATWWSSLTPGEYCSIYNDDSYLGRGSVSAGTYYSVRCVKD